MARALREMIGVKEMIQPKGVCRMRREVCWSVEGIGVWALAALVSAALAAVWPSPAAAQTSLGLKEAVAEALRHNPQLEGADALVAAAEGRREQAGLPPNPTLFTQSEDARGWGGGSTYFFNTTEDFAYVGQEIETAGKRPKRVGVAGRDLAGAQLAYQLRRAQIIGAVSSAYWAAAGAARIRDLLAREMNAFHEILDYSRGRVREGASAEADLIRMRIEADRLALFERSAEQEAYRAQVLLYQTMGRREFPTSTTFTDSLETRTAVSPPDIATVLQNRLEMKLARAAVGRAAANLDLQRANAYVNPTVLAGYKRNFQFDTLFFGVYVPLPLWNRNQGNIAAADAEARAARASLLAEETAVRADFATASDNYRARRQTVTRLLPEMQDAARDTYRIASAAFRLGGADLLRFLDAERTEIETGIVYYRALADYQQAAVNLRLAAGMIQ